MGNRERLYACERTMIGPVSWYCELAGAQFDVDRFLRSKWWRKRSKVKFVTLKYPAAGMSGAVKLDETHWEIAFGPKSVCDLNVAHELTHVLVGVTNGTTLAHHEKDHSKVFAGAELEVVKWFVGAEASGALGSYFEERGVKVEPFS